MLLARSQVAPGRAKSVTPRDFRKSFSAWITEPPSAASVLICCAAQLATFSNAPLLSSACVTSPPPGMNSMAARKMLAGLASTEAMLIGFTPITMVNSRKPGMMLALSAM